MSEAVPKQPASTYSVREVVGVLPDPDTLQAAIEELEIAGCDRALISVLASDDKIKDRLGHLYRTVAEAEDDRSAPRAAFVSSDARTEGEAAAVAMPFFIAGLAGAFGVVSFGGSLAAAIAVTIASGAVAGGLGGLLAHAMARNHACNVEHQLARGGLLLWVSVPDKQAEERALDVLRRFNAAHIHVHELRRPWDVNERLLYRAQPDPFLERDA